MDVRSWLREHDLEEHWEAFAGNGVDASVIPDLSNDDLKDLGVNRLGDRKRLLKAIESFSGAPKPTQAAIAAADGERRQVTVLFADLAGFTTLSTTLDPEDLHALLTQYYEHVDTVIERYGGTIDKHLGDGVMALFGAPVAHGDDPLRAVRAAFDIHAEMAVFSRNAARELAVHVGIASGSVVAGGLGRDGHKEYTVLGDSVNLASRLDGLADNGETMIDEVVYNAVAPYVDCAPQGAVPIKGLSQPVSVWKAVSLLDAASNIKRSPFVGRLNERRLYESALLSCLEDNYGHSLLIRGDAGIGKTRLLEEFISKSEHAGFSVHKGLVLDFGVGKGQDAIGLLVRSLLTALTNTIDLEMAFNDDRIGESQQVFLRDLLGLPHSSALYNAMDNAQRTKAKQDAVADLVRTVSTLTPVVLIVEDIHWADPVALEQFASLSATVSDTPALLVMTSRFEGAPLDGMWRSQTRTSSLVTIDMAPLRKKEALALASEFLDQTQSTAMRCIERADGNPLFLEQLLRNAEQSKDDAVPASIQSLLLSRIDLLPPVDKDALQAASIIGQRFSLDDLRLLIDNPDYDAAELIRQQLIRPEGDNHLFSHALLQESVYSSLLKARRHKLHHKAAKLFAATDLVLKAEHLDRAEDPAAPMAYHEAALGRAEEYHYEQAQQLVDRGLELAVASTDTFELTCLKGKVLHDLGLIDQSLKAYESALTMADDAAQKCQSWLGLAAGMRILDRYDDALRVLDEAETTARDQNLISERGAIHHIRGNLFFAMGRNESCAAEHEQSLAFAEQNGSPEAQASALSGLADARYAVGHMASAYKYYSRCVSVAAANGFGGIEMTNLAMSGFTRMYLNDLDGALEDGAKAIDAAIKIGNHRAAMLGHFISGQVRYEQAEFSLARHHTDTALDFARRLGAPRFEAQALLYEGKIELAEGKTDQAIKVLESALKASKDGGHAFAGARIMATLARCERDPTRQRAALEKGQQMLDDGSISHNHLFFYPDAMEVALNCQDWPAVERYVTAFAAYTKDEPLPWSTFFNERANALAASGQGNQDAEVLTQLFNQAQQAGLNVAGTALKRAL